MHIRAEPPATVVVVFGDRPVPGPLTGLPTQRTDDLETALRSCRRLVVVGGDADLAGVLTRLLRTDRLDIEVGYAPRRRTRATRVYRLPAGRRAARRARHGTAHRVPLIRDETATAIVGRAAWIPPDQERLVRGEAVVDDTVLFDGEVAGVHIEPTPELPGLRAALEAGPWRRWISGRAAQLGTTGAAVVRDGVAAPRSVRRSSVYRHVEGWLLVR
ncbi:peptidase M50 [Mycobacterium kansasii]|uniref:Peptidase M50 n=1 Tax=Mycobacterium attenuatum TaxID=2341086 RepID=A0A498PQZ5_9MYCO|nr:peptidase M50 [Mycobacterium attenuatum]ORB85243.1 peptidase M50 [Mycobacterium kansasii]VBA33823.1 hypothetical protein LAUMK136_00514 [Mycobacterium attenuatum]VBA46020.1 hypothetical protein LAUMK191_00508 [Mycobacterium attenuatum]